MFFIKKYGNFLQRFTRSLVYMVKINSFFAMSLFLFIKNLINNLNR